MVLANRYTTGMTSTTSVSVNFKRHEMVILGSEYAGEMKKGVTYFLYILVLFRILLDFPFLNLYLHNNHVDFYRHALFDAKGRCSFSPFLC